MTCWTFPTFLSTISILSPDIQLKFLWMIVFITGAFSGPKQVRYKDILLYVLVCTCIANTLILGTRSFIHDNSLVRVIFIFGILQCAIQRKSFKMKSDRSCLSGNYLDQYVYLHFLRYLNVEWSFHLAFDKTEFLVLKSSFEVIILQIQLIPSREPRHNIFCGSFLDPLEWHFLHMWPHFRMLSEAWTFYLESFDNFRSC